MTTSLFKSEKPAHWYLPNGEPLHTVQKKDGSGERPTTLADARKLGLLPSVTSILSIKAKPALDAWRLEQGILSALTLPRGTEEPIDEFAKRVVVDAEEQSRKAAEFGTKIHQAIEDAHKLGVFVQGEDYAFIKGYEDWFHKEILQVLSTEETVVNQIVGYAGRVDVVAETKNHGVCVIDIKTQKRVSETKKEATFYPEWGMQLAAYQQAILLQGGFLVDINIMSVVINSNKPDDVSVTVWEKPERYYEAFKSCVNLWQFDRNYYPSEVKK